MPPENTVTANEESLNNRPAWHTLPPEFASARLETDAESGLSEEEAARRLAAYGPNTLAVPAAPGWQRFLVQPGLLLLAGLAVVLFAGELFPQALLVLAAALLQAGSLAYFQVRQQRTLEALSRQARPPAVVLRDGSRRTIPAEEVVPGDLILLEHGRIVPAEARLVTATSLQVCRPEGNTRRARWDKTTDARLAADTPAPDRSTMVHPGMLVCRGLGSAVVVATGGLAERLAALPAPAADAGSSQTTVQQQYQRRARGLALLALAASLLLPAIGWWQGFFSPAQALAFGLALAYALLPLEGAAIIGVLLAFGAERLGQRLVRLRNLQAVETLSAVSAVLSSKTGLLTDGALQVQRAVPAAWTRQLLEIALMTTITGTDGNDPVPEAQTELQGDSSHSSMDAALQRAASLAGLDVDALRANRPVEGCYQLDPLRRRMSVIYRRGVRHWVSVKGSTEAVLEACTRRWTADGVDHLTEVDRQAIVETAAVLAEGGGRVIALAERALPPEEARRALTPASVERDLNFAGLLALTDSLRPESSQAVQHCRQAGIQLLLVTGDHPVAARAAGLQSGLAQADTPVLTGKDLAGMSAADLQKALYEQRVLAQVNPLQKQQVVQALQSGGACVAATGNFLTESPVLRAADLGVARQDSGSDAARLAADLVLVNGRFSTLVRAIARGRLIYSNLSKTLSLYLGAKLGLGMAVALPVLLGLPLPFSAVQLVLAGFGLATVLPLVFAGEAPEHGLMRRPPRPRAGAPFSRLMMARLLRSGFGLFVVVTISYFGSLLGFGDLPRARTLAFSTWMLMLVLAAYSQRSDTRLVLSQNPFSNRALFTWGMVVLVVVLALALVPAAAALVGGGVPGLYEWLLGLLALGAGMLFVEVRKWVASRGLAR